MLKQTLVRLRFKCIPHCGMQLARSLDECGPCYSPRSRECKNPYAISHSLISIVPSALLVTSEYLITAMPMKIPLREAFASSKAAFGVWNTIPGVSAVRTMASTPGISVSN